MSSDKLPSPLSRSDFKTIEAAVMETDRGRWFLSEYARNNRHSDTAQVLDAIEKLQLNLSRQRDEARLDRMRKGLIEMARAIAITHIEVERIRPEGLASNRLFEASGELDAIVHTTEQATSAILAATEQVQEHAWTMRERGEDVGICDALDACTTEIYGACGFQDVTAQRTRKVIDTLMFVENRIKSMMEIWDIEMPGVENFAAVAMTDLMPDPEKFPQAVGGLQDAVDITFDSVCAESPPAENTARDEMLTGGGSPESNSFSGIDALSPEDRLRLFR